MLLFGCFCITQLQRGHRLKSVAKSGGHAFKRHKWEVEVLWASSELDLGIGVCSR